MKKALVLFMGIFLIGFSIYCQPSLITDSTTINGSGEHIRLFTDRSIYCVNETIYLTASYYCDSEADSIIWSRVLYVELIKWNGTKLAAVKIKLNKTGASSSLRIPPDILSGNYYLRAYTKWMRNFSPDDYAYRPIKIINPFTAETDPGPAKIESSESIFEPAFPKEVIKVSCSTDKSQYQSGEKATVEIFMPDEDSSASHDFCVSIAKVGTIDTTLHFPKTETKESGIVWGNINYLPEISGITISGRLVDKTSEVSKENLIVNLSEPANGEYYAVYQTRAKGRFIFSLPDLYGKYDFFVQSEKADTGHSKFLIDNDFCIRPVLLPYVAFKLNEEEKEVARDMMINMQLNNKFFTKTDSVSNRPINSSPAVPFYGSRRNIYYTNKYIEMPNIEEFVIEVVEGAIVVMNNGKNELKFTENSGFSNYPPLLFLDNIMVNNDDRLLKLPLDKIERVEIIESGYAVGSTKYSGLLSFYSKKKDFAQIDMNKNSMFFSYDLFSDYQPDYNPGGHSNDSRVPDLRNVLYWNPDISLSAHEKTSISFNTSDNKGDYVVYISGKNVKDNKEVYGKCFFSVK